MCAYPKLQEICLNAPYYNSTLTREKGQGICLVVKVITQKLLLVI